MPLGFSVFFCVRHTTWTSGPGFTKCHSLDGATLLLPEKWLQQPASST